MPYATGRASSAAARRSRSLRLTAVCLTAAAALTLTACGGDSGSGVRTSGGANDASAAQRTGAKGSAEQQSGGSAAARTSAGTGTGSGKGSKRGTAGGGSADGSGTTAGQGRGGKVPTCTPANVEVQLQAVKRPVNHMILTATNTSRRPCNAYAHPYVTFDGDKAGLEAVEDSKPQAVTTIAPGETAYAGISLSAADGSGANGREASEIAVAFAEVDAAGEPGRPVALPAPGGSVHVDDSGRVTYWLDSAGDALAW
ncbi:DUF4232 domain-containing protein [Streptomyces sp. 8N616]|uniref:DUF4232 domain-containing protein n=1 Tax=Streptomyces sp. 8N616 TaxID=3457414 RepID=UPI003FD54038